MLLVIGLLIKIGVNHVLKSLRDLEFLMVSLLRGQQRGRSTLDQDIEMVSLLSRSLRKVVELGKFGKPLIRDLNFGLGHLLRFPVMVVDDFFVVGFAPFGSNLEDHRPGEDAI